MCKVKSPFFEKLPFESSLARQHPSRELRVREIEMFRNGNDLRPTDEQLLQNYWVKNYCVVIGVSN